MEMLNQENIDQVRLIFTVYILKMTLRKSAMHI